MNIQQRGYKNNEEDEILRKKLNYNAEFFKLAINRNSMDINLETKGNEALSLKANY